MKIEIPKTIDAPNLTLEEVKEIIEKNAPKMKVAKKKVVQKTTKKRKTTKK